MIEAMLPMVAPIMHATFEIGGASFMHKLDEIRCWTFFILSEASFDYI